MRIGIDFDNTIACYDGVFHRAALEQGLIPADLPTSKNAVRDYLNSSGRKDEFTLLQGYVYGTRMDLASPYPGILDFLARVAAAGHRPFIISHKSRHPMLGPRHDMHAAAQEFLEVQRLIGAAAVQPEDVFFEETKADKIARAVGLGCDVFIDDLPEILSMPGLPPDMRRVLFDPDGHHATMAMDPAIERCRSWAEVSSALFGTEDPVMEHVARNA